MTVFSTKDIFGSTVKLTKDTLYNHIASSSGHSEMLDNVMAIQRTVEDPNVVYKSERHPETRKVFFSNRPESTYPMFYTKVVVNYQGSEGVVTTAHFQKSIQGVSAGGLLYVKKTN